MQCGLIWHGNANIVFSWCHLHESLAVLTFGHKDMMIHHANNDYRDDEDDDYGDDDEDSNDDRTTIAVHFIAYTFKRSACHFILKIKSTKDSIFNS